MKFKRTEILIGKDKMKKLSDAKVIVFGIGGVGGAVCEALARGGIGSIDIVDCDTVSESNINRQAVAYSSTVGRYKTDVMKEKLSDINPDINVTPINLFYTKETADEIDFSGYDYVVDAVDTVTAKLLIIEKAKEKGAGIISSMGTGNKLDPTLFEIADISKTSVCPLAKVMRYELKKRNIKNVKVLFSKEIPLVPEDIEGEGNKRKTPGSMSFVPPVAGMIIAGEVIKDIAGI